MTLPIWDFVQYRSKFDSSLFFCLSISMDGSSVWIHLGLPSRQLHLGLWIPQLHLKPLSPSFPWLHHGLSSLRHRWAPLSLGLCLRLTSLYLCVNLPPLWLCKAPPSLRLCHCPWSYRLVPGLPSLHLHLSHACLWLHLGPPGLTFFLFYHPGSISPRLHTAEFSFVTMVSD